MKQRFKTSILAIAVATTLCTLFISCQKNEKPTVETSTVDKIKKLDSIYLTNHARKSVAKTTQQAQTPSAWKTVCFDAAGAAGGMFLGPFGAFCGGLCSSIGYAFGADDLTISGPVKSTNPENPFDNYGSMHNQVCSFLFADKNLITDASGKFDPNKTFDNGAKFGVANYSEFFGASVKNVAREQITQMYNTMIVNVTGSNSDLLSALEKSNYITTQDNLILTEYLNTFTSVDNPIDYSVEAERIVLNSKDLAEQEKQAILTGMAVGRNSYMLWQSK